MKLILNESLEERMKRVEERWAHTYPTKNEVDKYNKSQEFLSKFINNADYSIYNSVDDAMKDLKRNPDKLINLYDLGRALNLSYVDIYKYLKDKYSGTYKFVELASKTGNIKLKESINESITYTKDERYPDHFIRFGGFHYMHLNDGSEVFASIDKQDDDYYYCSVYFEQDKDKKEIYKNPSEGKPMAFRKEKTLDEEITFTMEEPQIIKNEEEISNATEPEEMTNRGLADMINALIKSEFDAVTDYNNAISTIVAENKMLELIPIFEDIRDEENVHIGQLQKALQQVSEAADNINKGVEEAEGQLEEPATQEI